MRLVLTALILITAGLSGPALASPCVSALDAQMVRFVPRTPSTGPNPLFRLIANPTAPTGAAHDCRLMRRAAAPSR